MKMSRVEEPLRVALAFGQAFNRHDVVGMAALLSEGCVLESAGLPWIRGAPPAGVYRGRQAIGRYWQDLFEKAPEAQIEIEEAFGLGFRCVARWRCLGEASRRGVEIFQVRDGLICEELSYVKGA